MGHPFALIYHDIIGLKIVLPERARIIFQAIKRRLSEAGKRALTKVRWVQFEQNQGLGVTYNRKIDRGEVGAAWKAEQTLEEKQQLEVIDRRLALKYAAIEELLAQRKRLMRRAIERRRTKARRKAQQV